jgi:two-component system chemotaxis response regulator CheB
MKNTDEKIILIGASTGGPRLIEQICLSLPSGFRHTLCIVQHMPESFLTTFADRLNRMSLVDVCETKHNMQILPSCVYLARGGIHMHFSKDAKGDVVIHENQEKGSSDFQPSVDEMMLSALNVYEPKRIIAVLLSGLGNDGARGMKEIKSEGGYTIGESESSAIVYGMPKVAYENDGVTEQLDIKDIVKKISELK